MKIDMMEHVISSVKSKDLLYGLFVSLCAFFVYANSLYNGFTLDDHVVIVNNPALKGSALSLFRMVDAAPDSQLLPFYRPLANLTFFLDGLIHDFNPFYIRLLNVLFHTMNSFLVYRLARSLFQNDAIAPFLTGLLFAIHPLNTEGVNFNAGGRITMMACFFSLAAYLLHFKAINYSRHWPATIGGGLFLAGLFSKEIALMILPFIIYLEYSQYRSTKESTAIFQSLIRLLPYAISAFTYLIMRWLTLSKLGIQSSIVPGFGAQKLESMYVISDLGTRLVNNIYIIPRYFLSFIWPVSLAPRYMVPDDLSLLALPLVLAWISLTCLAIYLLIKGRSRATLFGIAWLLLFWLPVSGVVVVPGAPLADRFMYLPAIGFWLILSDQAIRLTAPSSPHTKRIFIYGLMAVLFILALFTIRRNLDWRDNITLFKRFAVQYPENVHARSGLGKAYFTRNDGNDRKLAEQEFDAVIRLDPFFPKAHTYLGVLLLDKGDFTGAYRHFEEALAIYPFDSVARLNRGITNEKLGRINEALMDYMYFLTMPVGTTNPASRQRAEERVRVLSKE